MTAEPDLELVHPDGCWMDPRAHEHRIHLLEQPTPERDRRLIAADVVAEPGGPRPVIGIPRPVVRRLPHGDGL